MDDGNNGNNGNDHTDTQSLAGCIHIYFSDKGRFVYAAEMPKDKVDALMVKPIDCAVVRDLLENMPLPGTACFYVDLKEGYPVSADTCDSASQHRDSLKYRMRHAATRGLDMVGHCMMRRDEAEAMANNTDKQEG